MRKHTVTIKWKVTARQLKQLRKCAKGWGHRTVEEYIKSLLKVHGFDPETV